MKELEPWIGDTEIEVGGLDAEKSVSKLGKIVNMRVLCMQHREPIQNSRNESYK